MTTGEKKRGTGAANRFSTLLNAEIRAEIARQKLSLRRLEELTSISKTRLGDAINQDKAPLNTNELDLLSGALKVSASELLRRTERTFATELAETAGFRSPGGRYNKAGEWIPETRAGYALAAYDSDEEKGVDYIDD